MAVDDEIRETTPIRGDATPLPSADGTAEVVRFDPDTAADITQEIRAVAEARSEEQETTGPIQAEVPRPGTEPPASGADEPLSVDEVRDAWAVLDNSERL